MTNTTHTRFNPDEIHGSRWSALNKCALWIHGCGDFATLQAGLLDRVNQVISHRASMFDIARAGTHGQTEFVSPVARGMAEDQLESYYERYAAFDYTLWSFDVHNVHVYRDSDLVDVERRNATPIYQGVDEAARHLLWLHCHARARGHIPGSLTLFRAREAGIFSDEELEAPTPARAAPEPAPVRDPCAEHRTASLREPLRGAHQRARSPPPRGRGAQDDACRQDQPRNGRGALYLGVDRKKHVNALYHKLGVKTASGLMALVREQS